MVSGADRSAKSVQPGQRTVFQTLSNHPFPAIWSLTVLLTVYLLVGGKLFQYCEMENYRGVILIINHMFLNEKFLQKRLLQGLESILSTLKFQFLSILGPETQFKRLLLLELIYFKE
jgi:hypothetical protein